MGVSGLLICDELKVAASRKQDTYPTVSHQTDNL
jgi:hypothetical protein